MASWPRLSGALKRLIQNEDEFDLLEGVEDRNSTAGFGDGFLTISTPLGIVTRPKMRTVQAQNVAGSFQTQVSTTGMSSVIARCTTSIATEVDAAFITDVFTNTSSQIRYASVAFSGSVTYNVLTTYGWIDKRGKP